MRAAVYIHPKSDRDVRETERECRLACVREGFEVGETFDPSTDPSVTLNDVFLPQRQYAALAVPSLADLLDAAAAIAVDRSPGRPVQEEFDEVVEVTRSFIGDLRRRDMRLLLVRPRLNASADDIDKVVIDGARVWSTLRTAWRAEHGRLSKAGQASKGGRPRKTSDKP